MNEPISFEHREEVRVIGEKPGSINEFAAINSKILLNKEGKLSVWITNLNMPYSGSISKFVTLDKIEKIVK